MAGKSWKLQQIFTSDKNWHLFALYCLCIYKSSATVSWANCKGNRVWCWTHRGASAGWSGRETTQIKADIETDGDFTPAWEKKWLFNIKPQHITLKPAGQTKRDRESGEAARLLSRGTGEMANQAGWGETLPYYFLRRLHNYDPVCMFWKIVK